MRRIAVSLTLLVALAVAAPAGAQLVDPGDPPAAELPGEEQGEENGGGEENGEGEGTGEGEGEGEGTEEGEATEEDGFEAQAAGDPAPFGHECEEQAQPEGEDVRFCPTTTTRGDEDDRVPSFDRVPLDVDVTLPAEGDGPFPTIAILHGYGGSKEDFESSNGPEGDDTREYHYNNVFYAQQGYAVINYSARGFGESCGQDPTTRANRDCDDGYVHLADQRFEARDTQHLFGLLVDEGIADEDELGVTGLSYGGGQSIQLALLNDRIADCDRGRADRGRSNCDPGRDNRQLKKWESPEGTDLHLEGAYPRWPWSDLVYSLLPNGRFLDFARVDPGDEQSLNPIGIPINTYLEFLRDLGDVGGFYCGETPAGTPGACDDENADINAWYARIRAGEPYDQGIAGLSGREIAEEIFEHHQGFGLPTNDPAPLLIQNGFTDDLFPIHEGLRLYNLLRDQRPNGARERNADVALQFGDLGHPRGGNDEEVDEAFNDQGAAFLDEKVRDESSSDVPDRGAATVFTQTCPESEPADGPFEADSWLEMSGESVTFGDDSPQSVTPTDAVGQFFDPLANLSGPCRPLPPRGDTGPAGTATYVGEEADADGYTMIGRPTMRARLDTTDPPVDDGAQLDSRLLDVAPDGQEILVSRGAYRLENDQDGGVTIQSNGNAWCFEEGHRPKLELVGRDETYLRQTTGPDAAFEVAVSNLEVELPVASSSCSTDDATPGQEDGGGDDDGGGSNGGGGGGGNGNGSGDGDGDGDADGGPAALARGVVLRAMATSECAFFGQNFGGPAKTAALALCVNAVVATLDQGLTPAAACQGQSLSGKRRRGERRSDLQACVLAATFGSERVRGLGL